MVSSPNSKSAKKVIVTGARSGIGLGIALAFLRSHDHVVLVSRSIDLESLSESKEEMERFVASGQAFLLQKDVSDVNECRSLVRFAVEALGGSLDVLVNNAGGGKIGVPVEDVSPELWRAQFALNLDSVFYLTQEALPHLRKTQGSVINISSIGTQLFEPVTAKAVPATHASSLLAGPEMQGPMLLKCSLRPTPLLLPYCCAKAALDALTKATAVAFGGEGVRVNSINPGVVDTPIFEHWGASEEQREFVLKRTAESTPLKRVGTPADVASLALFLADNEAASWLTGQVIALDGGKLLEFSHD